ncbi:MAG: sn-glycerol-3-phosphate ABC transporter ATP-binding protein UgpC [Paracoccaceae bacterium]|nr:sn-glycerol-3-phosphate ABC transporter ATP-binding protein UgpC [Paracoccaceae bacterium]
MVNDAALSIENLYKSFGQVEILKDISLSIEKGDFLVLVGPSGCGKSTLLNCIAGLEETTKGGISIAGRDVTGEPPRDRDIAMVFQSYALYPTMTVADNIGFGMKVRRAAKSEIAEKVGDVASLLQIDHLLDRRPSQLSGGQRQRVAMGRALVRKPALFLFDEPLSNLDAKLRVEMRAEIKRLHQSTGTTIVYVTHDQIEAMTLATKIVVLKDGIIQQIGTPEDIYDRPANTFVADFMGSPPMNLVPASITDKQLDFGGGQTMKMNEPGKTLSQRGKITVGFRPELMELSSPDTGNIPVTVDMVEMTGADSYVSFRLGDCSVTARTPGRFPIPEGGTAGLNVPLDSLHFFDSDSGKLIN